MYIDDLTMFCNKIGDNLTNMQKIFYRCHTYDISLNTKKSIFVVAKGKFLGYVICKYGIVIDPKRIESITEITYPDNRKAM